MNLELNVKLDKVKKELEKVSDLYSECLVEMERSILINGSPLEKETMQNLVNKNQEMIDIIKYNI